MYCFTTIDSCLCTRFCFYICVLCYIYTMFVLSILLLCFCVTNIYCLQMCFYLKLQSTQHFLFLPQLTVIYTPDFVITFMFCVTFILCLCFVSSIVFDIYFTIVFLCIKCLFFSNLCVFEITEHSAFLMFTIIGSCLCTTFCYCIYVLCYIYTTFVFLYNKYLLFANACVCKNTEYSTFLIFMIIHSCLCTIFCYYIYVLCYIYTMFVFLYNKYVLFGNACIFKNTENSTFFIFTIIHSCLCTRFCYYIYVLCYIYTMFVFDE